MPLSLAFIDPTGGDYTPETPRIQPLGGSQSALCYLAEGLAAAGCRVRLVNGTSTPGRVRGVECRNLATLPWDELSDCQATIILNDVVPAQVQALRAALPAPRRLVLWTQHAATEPMTQALRNDAIRGCFDAFVFVSQWQRDAHIAAFRVDPDRSRVLRNAIAPAFAGLFAGTADIAAAKPWPPVLAYTSTPFRGLDVLLDALPAVRAAIPGTVLRVFSSLATYQVPLERDPYAALYRRCRETEGVDYVGAVSQTALAEALKQVNALAYLNRFAETSCVAVMEAMAAGCLVVTSQLGALAETTSGFAQLVPVAADPAEHAARYAERLCDALLQGRADAASLRGLLRAQVDHANRSLTWPARVAVWRDWLQVLCRAPHRTLAAAGGDDRPLAALLRRATEAVRQMDADRADRLCRQALMVAPAHAPAWRMLAALEQGVARSSAAARALGRAGAVPDRERAALLMPRLAGLAPGADGAPLAERIAAVASLAEGAGGWAADVSWRGPLAAATGRLVSEAERAQDAAASQRALALLVTLRPGDAAVQIALALALSKLLRHDEALELIRRTLREAPTLIQGNPAITEAVRQCVAAAATPQPGPASPARRQALLDEIAALSGMPPAHPRAAPPAAAGPAAAPPTVTLPAATIPAATVSAAARPATVAVAALPEAASPAADPVTRQARLLERLLGLVNQAASARRGADAAWQQEARELVAELDRSLRADAVPEAVRSSNWAKVRGLDAWIVYHATLPQLPPPQPAPPHGRRVYDCFQFFNELDMLELRLTELESVVDRFVLVEATTTHAGDPKPLHYRDNQARFARWADRIVHVMVEDDPGVVAWEREANQREAIGRGLSDCSPDDLILVSDVDEIPDAGVLARLRVAPDNRARLFVLHYALHLYFLDLKSPEPWLAVAAAPWELVRRIGPNRVRYLARQKAGPVIADAGWHLTWMGGVERFLAKLDAYAHRENAGGFAQDPAGNLARLERFFATGSFDGGTVPGMWTGMQRVPFDASFPATVRREPERYRQLGWLMPSAEPVEEAEIAALRRQIAGNPPALAERTRLAERLHALGRLEEAEAEQAVLAALAPADAPALGNLGVLRMKRGQEAAGVAALRGALALAPSDGAVLANLGTALWRRGGSDVAAQRILARAVAVEPNSAAAWQSLALVLRSLHRIDEAQEACRALLRFEPDHVDAHFILASCQLLAGDLERGFREYEWRRRRADFAPLAEIASPLWDGVDPAGKTLLVHDEQGFGDSIQFIRYAPLLQRQGARVVVLCAAELVTLFEGQAGIAAVVPRGAALPPHDAHVALLSLPHLLGTTAATVPAEMPYLTAAADRVAAWDRRLGPRLHPAGLRVGLVWAGSAKFKDDRWRSPGLAAMLPLAAVPGVQTFGLQKGDGRRDLDRADALPPGFTDLGEEIRDFADTAAIMANLDLVISSCTAPAHLAGALARPVWTILPEVCDWRWRDSGTDTPWYPTMQLFRQPRAGDWGPVITAVRAALAAAVP